MNNSVPQPAMIYQPIMPRTWLNLKKREAEAKYLKALRDAHTDFALNLKWIDDDFRRWQRGNEAAE